MPALGGASPEEAGALCKSLLRLTLQGHAFLRATVGLPVLEVPSFWDKAGDVRD